MDLSVLKSPANTLCHLIAIDHEIVNEVNANPGGNEAVIEHVIQLLKMPIAKKMADTAWTGHHYYAIITYYK